MLRPLLLLANTMREQRLYSYADIQRYVNQEIFTVYTTRPIQDFVLKQT